MSTTWSQIEIEQIVADYFSMLKKELLGQQYSKTDHRKALAPRLHGRTSGSIERKHQNISAVMIALRLPYITGYKPLANFQMLLHDVIVDQLDHNPEISAAVADIVRMPAQLPELPDILERLTASPCNSGIDDAIAASRQIAGPSHWSQDYLMIETRNESLSVAGQRFVVEFERARLSAGGRGGLAHQVERLSDRESKQRGFAIRSFAIDGSERFINVKTTAFGPAWPILLTQRELQASADLGSRFALYRVFRFRSDPHLYTLQGKLDERCRLAPNDFVAWPNA